LFLKRIELSGFKSFPDKYEIIMDDKITGIVGPNGSGKSNIGDAMRWVLGEQSAKSLRGEKMEDVIFNGTQLRKQKAYCEVSLTFNNSDGRIASDYSEIEIMRKMYRSGESEYYINRAACRLKDILELFRDTGIGKEGYSIIGQGKIDEILNERAVSRRKVFEEAAGIMKYRVRKEESERKLVKSEENLTRVKDIIDELELQVEPLKAQCEDAKRYFELKEAQKILELNIFINTFERGKERAERLKKELKGLQEENEQKTFELNGLSQSYNTDEDELSALDGEFMKINAEISANMAEIQRLEGEIRLESEKARHLAEEIERLEAEIEKDAADKALLEKRLRETEQAVKNLNAVIAGKEGEENALAAELETALAGFDGAAMEREQAAYREVLLGVSDVKSLLSALTAKNEVLLGKKAELEAETEKIRAEADAAKTAFEETAELIRDIKAKNAALLSKINELTVNIKEGGETLQQKQQEKAKILRRADELASRAGMLKDMQENFDGYFESVKSLLLAAQRDQNLGKHVIGPVASMISVPEKYEAAIDAVLGAAMQNIIVPDEYDAKALIEYLRQKDLGKATFLPLAALKVKSLSREERAALSAKGAIGVASELIDADPKAKTAVEFLLARTVIAEDMDSAIALMRATGYSFRTVTLKGDVLNSGGVITGGSTKKRSYSLISRERMLAEVEGERQAVQKSIDALDESIAGMQKKLEALNASRQKLLEENRSLDVQMAGAIEKSNAGKKGMDEYAERLEAAGRGIENITLELQNAGRQIAENTETQEELQRKASGMEAAIKDLEQRTAKVNEDLSRVKDKLSAIRIELAALRAEKEAKRGETERLEYEIKQNVNSSAEKAGRIQNAHEETEKIALAETDLRAALSAEKEKSEALREKLNKTAERKEQLQQKIKGKVQNRQNLQDALNSLMERRFKIEMQISKLESDIETSQNRVWEDYQLTYMNALEFRKKINLNTAQQELETIKEDIRNLGAINPKALEDYKRVVERRDFLHQQREDLVKAIDDLKHVISELMQNMRASFKDRFQIINAYFQEAFTELFGGGRALLQLQDEEDIMECGIDIIAEPPGKKLQNISLLSGGEKAMTAIALLFAMQRLNPSPVCFLDEIDAALDDANVVRFTEYIKKYTRKVQFLIITHRKPTMAICDSLYGIAMEEKGVSKMLSVKMA
jgi:chromosome segregation protein